MTNVAAQQVRDLGCTVVLPIHFGRGGARPGVGAVGMCLTGRLRPGHGDGRARPRAGPGQATRDCLDAVLGLYRNRLLPKAWRSTVNFSRSVQGESRRHRGRI